MLLQRIRLKGFLGHRGLSSTNGGDGFVDIDLRSSPLWLIHGPNGGGKSCLWDAVTFALFKKHRASTKQNDRLVRLIHDAEDEAVVELEFDLRGQQYMIQSKISKTRRRLQKGEADSKPAKSKHPTIKTWNIVNHWERDDWESVPGTENKADEWVQRNVGISYETFVRAVLLRQGEADAFMRDPPAQRKRRLLELLQLEFYEELGKKANEHVREQKGKYDSLKNQLDNLPQPTEESLIAQQQCINNAERKSDNKLATLQGKEHELNNARQAEYLLHEIAVVQERLNSDLALIGQWATIETNACLYRELKVVLRTLHDLWEARRLVERETQALDANTERIVITAENHRILTDSLERCRLDEQKAEQAFGQASARLEQASAKQRVAKDQAANLEQIEIHEKEIQAAEEELKPYQDTIQQAHRIQQSYERHTELGRALPLLQALKDAGQELDDARQQFQSRRVELNRGEAKAQHDTEEEQRLRQVEQNILSECDRFRQELNSRLIKLEQRRDKMEARNSVSGEEECPTCGSALDENSRVRIEQERKLWAAEIGELESELKTIKSLLEEETNILAQTRAELLTAADATRSSRDEVVRARSELNHAEADVARAEKLVANARVKAGDWAQQLLDSLTLTEEFKDLAHAPEDWYRLLEAQKVENRIQSEVRAHRKRLIVLPQWTPEERRQVRAAAENIDQTVVAYGEQKADAEFRLKLAQDNRNETEKEQLRVEVELRTAQERQVELTGRKREAEDTQKTRESELPDKWTGNSACVDEAALNKLKAKFEDLEGAEKEERELQEARLRQEGHKGSLDILRAQLEDIPVNHCRDVTEVQRERDAADADVQQAHEELRAAKEHMAKLAEQKRIADQRREEFIDAEREFRYFRLLADAFGPSGLRAKVVQSAQETIKIHANMILGRLSNGEWQVELHDVSETELEIRARNVMQPGAQPRPFEYLSGGEKFRVAVSLAVAIGQSVLGNRVVDTLVIDEGFGSLDEINRELMAKEMSHLSEEVLRGGRVVVVSHQEDVCGEFGNRYRLSKDEEGYVQVERLAIG